MNFARRRAGKSTAARRCGCWRSPIDLDGYEREEAARLAGMSDQALRGSIERLNADGLSSFTLEDIRRMIAGKHGAEYHTGYMASLMIQLKLSRQ